jgi:hypothetical protein
MADKPLPTIPVGGIQVIPPPQKSSSNVVIKPYKTQKNNDIEMKSKVVTINNKCSIDVNANESVIADINFKYTYQNVPYVTYQLLCNDADFGIEHRIRTISNDSFSLMIMNKLPTKRSVDIIYKITQV